MPLPRFDFTLKAHYAYAACTGARHVERLLDSWRNEPQHIANICTSRTKCGSLHWRHTKSKPKRRQRRATAAKGPGQEVGGASHGPGHLSKVNKRVDNWARRWSLRAVSEERSGSRSRGKEGAGKRSQQRDQLRAKRFNFIIKQWGDKVAADFIYGPGLVSRHSTAGTRWHPSLLPRPPFLSFTHELQQIALRRHAKVALSLMHCTGIR